MCKERGRRKATLGVFGVLSAVAVGGWAKLEVTSHQAAPKPAAAATEPAATGGGFPTGTVIVTGVIALAVVVWLVVRKIRDIWEDRRLAEARRIDLVAQMEARHQQQIEPRKWRYTLTERIDNELVTLGSQVFEYAATSKREVAREVERRALERRPGQYRVEVELVSP